MGAEARLGLALSAHNLEVAGSNRPPATNAVAGQRRFPTGEGLLFWPCVTKCVVGTVTESVIRDVSAAPAQAHNWGS
jgi:hypothetical protein